MWGSVARLERSHVECSHLECARRKRGIVSFVIVELFFRDGTVLRRCTGGGGLCTPATGSKLASSAADASAEPSPEVLKEARREGFTPKKRSGVTQYCSSDATLGTRFVTEKCYNEQDMEREVHRRQDQRNLLHQQAGCGGANCSGH